ncbi:hypothetical protein M5X00_23735 [Paenibacillus alvei]|uniref:NIPSNAP domain-containing protein n=1 Tax=Paenibacillus alvei TaxID=44250 RepID=A0ABT4H0R9_PAEAL|nr:MULTISPECIES: hypothetical protein [Paenibacillus]EJW15010.1 hypothetical protein PAV_10c01280 [Paenibacillus alvei DSM 29]MCY7483452.1 hypothetical protein [Paenibacillus alvei]MCY9541051.1 hypothetical protein [Paenibacillus alvei]MCY9703786.1 hypothetical protein [Paenibacillus alvei]MCY9734518.1 hypothetical protein [Paenibacillus alvei]
MNIIFVEYRVDPDQRAQYLEQITERLKQFPQVVLYEGTDQPNVFVEQWMNTTPEDYKRLKRIRLEDSSEWDAITACIPGGKSKLHIWEFASISSQG